MEDISKLIVFEGRKRYYVEDLSVRDYLLENTTPYKCTIFEYVIEESSWGELLRSVATLLLSLYPMDKSTLLSFKCPWSNSSMFADEIKTNFKMIDNGLYINCNHTALHSCWFLQDLFDLFNIERKNVVLLIHRPSGAESPEIREFISNRVKKEFCEYLEYANSKTEEYSKKVINNIEKYLNPILRSFSKSYVDFFLFDDYLILVSYVNKVRDKINANCSISDNNKKILNKYLNYLVDYYKV